MWSDSTHGTNYKPIKIYRIMKSYATPRVKEFWAVWQKMIFWFFYPVLCLIGIIFEEKLWRMHAERMQKMLDDE